jgi:hypothetical protein
VIVLIASLWIRDVYRMTDYNRDMQPDVNPVKINRL